MDDHTEAEPLKGCPFCGGDAATFGGRVFVGVRCKSCGVIGPEKEIRSEDDEPEAEALAIAAWNQRATQASAVADLLETLPELSTRLAAAAKSRVVVGYSKRALCEEAHAAIQALSSHLRAPAAGDNPSPVDATASLIDAARAVVDRWHAPVWKEVEHTAAFIARLDEAATRAAGAALRKLTTAGQAYESYEGVIDCRTCVHIGPMKDCTAPFGCAGGASFERRSALQLWGA